MITAALEPLPLGVGMSLVTNILAELLIEFGRRGMPSAGPSMLARIGRDGLYSSITAHIKDHADVTLARPGGLQ